MAKDVSTGSEEPEEVVNEGIGMPSDDAGEADVPVGDEDESAQAGDGAESAADAEEGPAEELSSSDATETADAPIEAEQSADDPAEVVSDSDDVSADEDDESLADDVPADDEAAEASSAPAPSASVRPKKTTKVAAPVAETTSSARADVAKKNRPTRTRAEAMKGEAEKSTTPAMFVGQSVQELKKVVWPTSAQLGRYFLVVLLFVLIMIAYVGLLDYGLGRLVLGLFGN
ncbi:MAG: preprotein translocase subunit SecE [Propionibacteriaceae bacterium]|nr:preprotein translocase subunit SecE [Propionibacteriaceae bacterium]